MSRRNGNRERVSENLEELMVALVAEEIEFEEFFSRVEEIAREHSWIVTEFDERTNVNPLEDIRAKVLQISPVPCQVPYGLENIAAWERRKL